jgi:hypothetical protein
MKTLKLLVFVSLFTMLVNTVFAQTDSAEKFSETLITHVNWDEFQKDLFTISPDSKRVIYVIKQNEKYYIIEDNKKSQAFDYVGKIVFSNDSKRYCALVIKGNKNAVVCDGKLGKLYSEINYGPVFSPDSKHFLYTVYEKNNQFVVYDTKEEKKYSSLSDPIFNSEGNSYAYAGFVKNILYTVLNGKELKKHELLSGDLKFSGNGKRIGYAVYKDVKKAMVIDGIEQKPFTDIIENSLKFDYLGNNYIYVAQDSNLHTVFVKNNVEEGKYSSVDTTILSKDGKNYYYTAQYKYNDYKRNFAVVTEYYVVHNGKQIGVFDEVMKNSLITDSTGEHYTFAAKKGGTWSIYYDGEIVGTHESESFPYLSFDGKTIVYATYKSDGKMTMVINKKEGDVYDQVFYPIFNPANNKVIYAAKQNNKVFLVTDGVKGKEYDDLLFYFFSYTGKDLVYGAISGDKRLYCINGKESKLYTDIKTALYSNDDKHLYLLVSEDEGLKLVVDGTESRLYNWIGGYQLYDEKAGEINFITLNNDNIYKVKAKLD